MDELVKILQEFASAPVDQETDISQEERERYYARFQDVYHKGFRHSYSLLSQFLERQSPDVYSSLGLWIMCVVAYGRDYKVKCDYVNQCLEKLLDHIELESIRLDRMKAVRLISQEGRTLNQETKNIAETAKQAAQEAREKVSTYQEQSIGILSIFSAVVLAFMGGISFSASVLNSIDQASMFRLIVTILLLGFVLFNSLFILLKFAAYLIHKNFHSFPFERGIKIFNCALLLLFVLTLLAYFFGLGNYIEQWGSK